MDRQDGQDFFAGRERRFPLPAVIPVRPSTVIPAPLPSFPPLYRHSRPSTVIPALSTVLPA